MRTDPRSQERSEGKGHWHRGSVWLRKRGQEGEIRLRDGSVRPTGAERERNEARSNERGSGAERSNGRAEERRVKDCEREGGVFELTGWILVQRQSKGEGCPQ